MSNVTFWFVMGAFATVEASIVVAALRMHVTTDPGRGILGARPVEVLWTLLPLLLVLAVIILSYQSFNDDMVTS